MRKIDKIYYNLDYRLEIFEKIVLNITFKLYRYEN